MSLHLGLSAKRFFFLSVALATATPLAPSPATGDREGVFRNDKFGYAVSYPIGWYPSGIRYSNAFELRSYDPQAVASVSERNRASVMFVDTVNENAEVTDRFIDSLKAETPFRATRFVVDGRRAVRIPRRIPSQPLGRGARRSTEAGPTAWFRADGIYIANGIHLLAVESRVPVEADRKITKDIDRILKGVKFSREPLRSRGSR